MLTNFVQHTQSASSIVSRVYERARETRARARTNLDGANRQIGLRLLLYALHFALKVLASLVGARLGEAAAARRVTLQLMVIGALIAGARAEGGIVVASGAAVAARRAVRVVVDDVAVAMLAAAATTTATAASTVMAPFGGATLAVSTLGRVAALVMGALMVAAAAFKVARAAAPQRMLERSVADGGRRRCDEGTVAGPRSVAVGVMLMIEVRILGVAAARLMVLWRDAARRPGRRMAGAVVMALGLARIRARHFKHGGRCAL